MTDRDLLAASLAGVGLGMVALGLWVVFGWGVAVLAVGVVVFAVGMVLGYDVVFPAEAEVEDEGRR